MKILITGGNTQIPIDQVRVISNIFKGNTSVDIAKHAIAKGHDVTLVGNPHMRIPVVGGVHENGQYYDVLDMNPVRKCCFVEYKTYDDLYRTLKHLLTSANVMAFDAIIHSAAVSDYEVEGVYAGQQQDMPLPNTSVFAMTKLDNDKKVGSEHKELFLKLTPTQKIVDLFRKDWGFTGKIVKFKLQVGISDNDLIKIAQKSRATSDADLIVANCLEWAKDKAYIVDRNDIVERVKRNDLASRLLEMLNETG
jgi:phosphopantothenate-cysteine ligase/phosphopantothenoylcysteine decarboxylase/phosphopantothenate--cysteine ligase